MDQNSSEEINISMNDFDMDYNKYSNYIGNKVFLTSSISSIIGISIGYYLESGMFLHFYSYGIAGSVVAIPFYTTNYLVRNIRKKDDMYNYAFSGSLTGSFKGKKFGLIASIVSTILGGSYKILEDSLYHTSRTAWINSRRYTIKHSQPKKLVRAMSIVKKVEPSNKD